MFRLICSLRKNRWIAVQTHNRPKIQPSRAMLRSITDHPICFSRQCLGGVYHRENGERKRLGSTTPFNLSHYVITGPLCSVITTRKGWLAVDATEWTQATRFQESLNVLGLRCSIDCWPKTSKEKRRGVLPRGFRNFQAFCRGPSILVFHPVCVLLRRV